MHCSCVRQSDLPNTTRLFADVLYHPDKTTAFYQHPLRNLEAFQAAAAQIEFSPERRAALIDALRVQNPVSPALERRAHRVLHPQRVDQCGSPLGGKLDLCGGCLKGLQVAQGMLVESGGFIRMIQYVREQTRSVGQVALSDAGTVHAWISLTDEQDAEKDSVPVNPPEESWKCRYKWQKPQSP